MKVGIIGAGNIANHMAEAICGLDESVELYAIASRNQERAQVFEEKWKAQKAYGSYEALVEDPQVDLVYIATPHSHHYVQTKLCLEHGKPALVEKSFTQNAAQARELIALAAEKRVFLTEAIWTRYMPSRQMVMDLIAAGTIGRVTSLSANLGYLISDKERILNPALAGGALLDLGVYPINFASMFFGGEVQQVSAVCTKLETGVDAQESITLTYEDGRMAFLYATALALSDRCGVINGDLGYMECQNINNIEEIRVYNLQRELTARYQVPKQINGYEYEVLACRNALEKGELSCAQMPHAETLRIMELMDEIRRQMGVRYPNEEQ